MRASTPVVEAVPAAATNEATDVDVSDEPKPQFSGVHFFLGAMAGAGPAWVSAGDWFGYHLVSFSALVPQVPTELRLGLLFGRFEVAAEVAPGSTLFFNGSVHHHASAAVSLGGLIKLYEREDFSVSLPIRARGGLVLVPRDSWASPGWVVGASAGVALRFGNALVEARLLAGEFRQVGAAAVVSLPFSLSFSWIF